MEKKPQGRPKGSTGTNNRTVRKSVFMTPEQWLLFEILAETEGVTVNSYYRDFFQLALKGLGDKREEEG